MSFARQKGPRQEGAAGSAGPGSTNARRHGRVFALGGTGMAAVVLVAGGLTWASQDDRPDAMAVASASPQASAAAAAEAEVGECGMVLGGEPKTLPLLTARRLTMIAAVGTQVRAPEVQTARAIDAALATPARKPLKVTDALGLLARQYADPASELSLARLRTLSTPGGLTCAFAEPKVKREKRGFSGLTPRAAWLRISVLDAFGKLPVGGYVGRGSTAPKAGNDKPADASARAGRAFDVVVTPVTDAGRSRGWTIAHWLVAGAGAHSVTSVTYDGWRWSAAAGTGWKPLAPPLTAVDAADETADAVVPAVTPSAAPPPSAADVARSVAAQYRDRVHVTVATGR